MGAAHIGDLDEAKAAGLSTAFVPRRSNMVRKASRPSCATPPST